MDPLSINSRHSQSGTSSDQSTAAPEVSSIGTGDTADTAPQPVVPRRRPPTGVAGYRGWLALSVAGLFLLGSGTAAALYIQVVRAQKTLKGLRLAGEPISEVAEAEVPARVHAIAERFLDRPVRLGIGQDTVRRTYREVGLVVDEGTAAARAGRVGHGGDPLDDLLMRWRVRQRGLSLPLPVTVSRSKALDFLMELKDQVDRSAQDARLDLEHHTIAAEKAGYLLRVYDSLVALEYAARSLSAGGEEREVELSVAQTQPRVRSADLKDIDVSTVLGSWETRYSNLAIDNDRTYNLKVGADKLNGHILAPGELFSFNEVVGNRTEKEGYRVAPVISGGELIDGLAGGMCQIASTLHAASFFAGLEIVRSTPHSRPSAYIPMGLDSTVVWPSVDLKLRNPYDFPVAMHYMVNQGSVKVELLGKARPCHAAFEREIITETPFGVEVRKDPTLPASQRIVEQEGYPGYHIKRRRYLYTGKWQLDRKNENRPKPEGLIGKKEWEFGYPATSQIVRQGTGPSSLKPKEAPPSHHIPAIPAGDKPIFYIIK